MQLVCSESGLQEVVPLQRFLLKTGDRNLTGTSPWSCLHCRIEALSSVFITKIMRRREVNMEGGGWRGGCCGSGLCVALVLLSAVSAGLMLRANSLLLLGLNITACLDDV